MYYLQSRYYDPTLGRFINGDAFAATGQGFVGNNMFAYCLNNPVSFRDPTGELAITISTLILIGSAVIGAGCAAYTAYVEYQAGLGTVRIIGDSICAGFAGFSIIYSAGISLYQCYQNYCYLNAITPATQIGSSPSIDSQLQTCADSANNSVAGNGPVAGTKKHTEFANNVSQLNNDRLRTEVSYKNGAEVPYGTKGSIRFDVIQVDSSGNPLRAWDFKTGNATLSTARIIEMQYKSGWSIPIAVVR